MLRHLNELRMAESTGAGTARAARTVAGRGWGAGAFPAIANAAGRAERLRKCMKRGMKGSGPRGILG
ncbi:MAG: hypothetical protein B7Z72_10100 [Gemmatimonadetes bacterium 21-71-4]|nr:MAG: hypothetical protein B7Z72_10100 [Gemmatimonadetes bacterium 21-71-4]